MKDIICGRLEKRTKHLCNCVIQTRLHKSQSKTNIDLATKFSMHYMPLGGTIMSMVSLGCRATMNGNVCGAFPIEKDLNNHSLFCKRARITF